VKLKVKSGGETQLPTVSMSKKRRGKLILFVNSFKVL